MKSVGEVNEAGQLDGHGNEAGASRILSDSEGCP